MKRVWEVDAVRGLAVVLMVGYHFFFDLNYFGFASVNLYQGAFLLWQRVTAALFLGLVGVSLVLFRQRHPRFGDFGKRAVKIGAAALLVTLATTIYPGWGNGAIVFGVLHFIALASLLAYFFLDCYWLNLALGVGLLAASLIVTLPVLQTPLLLWLGFPPAGFYTLDYYPLFPWFGLVLVGIFVGKTLYEKKEDKNGFANRFNVRKPFNTSGLEFVGRNALSIYLLHQPVLIALLFAAKGVVGA